MANALEKTSGFIGLPSSLQQTLVHHHSDRGVQYLSIRYTERLGEAGAVCSVGSRGDSYDNALAETMIGLFKTELIRNRGPWKNLDEVEYATLEWVDWFNHRRLLEPIGGHSTGGVRGWLLGKGDPGKY